MADSITYGQLTVGQKYTLVNGEDTDTIWLKIKTQTKGCCRNRKVVANARNSVDATKTAIHKPSDKVVVVG